MTNYFLALRPLLLSSFFSSLSLLCMGSWALFFHVVVRWVLLPFWVLMPSALGSSASCRFYRCSVRVHFFLGSFALSFRSFHHPAARRACAVYFGSLSAPYSLLLSVGQSMSFSPHVHAHVFFLVPGPLRLFFALSAPPLLLVVYVCV